MECDCGKEAKFEIKRGIVFPKTEKFVCTQCLPLLDGSCLIIPLQENKP